MVEKAGFRKGTSSFPVMLLWIPLPGLSEEAEVCVHRVEATDCRFHPSVARSGAFHSVEAAACDHQEAAVDCHFHPSTARGVSFLRPF